jgi:hypothetical protein
MRCAAASTGFVIMVTHLRLRAPCVRVLIRKIIPTYVARNSTVEVELIRFRHYQPANIKQVFVRHRSVCKQPV